MMAPNRFDRWVFEEFQPCAKGLPFFRILFAVYLLVFYVPRFSQLAGMPHSFFHPPLSLATLLPGIPPNWFFYVLDFLGELGAVCLLFGYRTRIVSFALLAVLLVGNTYRFSIGPKIDHEILLLATLFCFGFSGWGNRLSYDEAHLLRSKRQNSAAWPIALLILIVGFCMFTAALPKAVSGWASPFFFASRGQMIANYIQMDRPSGLADLILRVHSPLFWKMADWSTLVIEGGFIFCMFSLGASRVIVSFATIFHAFIFYSMNIFFAANLITYACLLDLRRFLRNSTIRHSFSRFRFLAHRVRLPHLIGLALVPFVLFLLLEQTEVDLTFLPHNLLILVASAIALASLLFMLAGLTDRLIFKHAFPLGANHSLVILYDGECGLCDKWVQFVLKHDRRGIFRFAPLQSVRGKELLQNSGHPESDLSSMVLIIDDQAYWRSTGPLMILRQLGGTWSLLGIFGLVPLFIRDSVYAGVAANRYRWFGKSNDSCRLLHPYERERFLS
jgi:predicted DCC family thiol-disulfide oxidoreductase YuxK/uncharacterized membrane protein YphA (DoxX/SURF4 family)